MAFYLLVGCSFFQDEDGRMDNGGSLRREVTEQERTSVMFRD